jgi:tetratricopeptide (TPR) repeat protein
MVHSCYYEKKGSLMNQHDHQYTESPAMMSLMGYTVAREAGQIQKGIKLCLKAIALNSHNFVHYLHLGRIYLLAKNKDFAIMSFRKGLKIRKDARMLEELKQLGIRRSPPFVTLSRGHVVNRVTGKILHTLKLR